MAGLIPQHEQRRQTTPGQASLKVSEVEIICHLEMFNVDQPRYDDHVSPMQLRQRPRENPLPTKAVIHSSSEQVSCHCQHAPWQSDAARATHI
jgi:hypothetical protein